MSDRIALVEVFRAPQGEGFNAGRQAIFVRTAGCNLSCVFAAGALCDTPYQRAEYKVTIDELFEDFIRPLDIADRTSLSRVDGPMLILTGGEPTLQPLFDEIVRRAYNQHFYVAVETNGTRWRSSLSIVDWISLSPKESVVQGSPSPNHNHNPQDPTLDSVMVRFMAHRRFMSCEYRHVIGPDDIMPEYRPAYRHYLSPAVLSDGTGQEWRMGFPGFVPGAVGRCLELCEADPRWRLSLQTHKIIGVR